MLIHVGTVYFVRQCCMRFLVLNFIGRLAYCCGQMWIIVSQSTLQLWTAPPCDLAEVMCAEAVDLSAWWDVHTNRTAAAEPAPPPDSPTAADDDDGPPPDPPPASPSQTHSEAPPGSQLPQQRLRPQMPPRGPHGRQRPVQLPRTESGLHGGGPSLLGQEESAAERGPLHVESRELSELPARAASGDWLGALPGKF